MNIRNIFNTIWPITRKQFKQYEKDMLERVKQIGDKFSCITEQNNEIIFLMKEEQKKIDQTTNYFIKNEDKNCAILQEKYEELKKKTELILMNFQCQNNINNQIINMLRMNKRISEENVWANVFHDAVSQTEWMKQVNFMPGRWAMGYQSLYVLYRILNETHPHSILELGLGESTKMISQYANCYEGVSHKVIEHDETWVKIFKERTKLSSCTSIIIKKITTSGVLGDIDGIRVYGDFSKQIMPGSYDLIVIDGPWGGDMKEFARIDIAGIMPECLDDSFVILMDDYNRVAEQRTIEYMKTILEENNIEYMMSKYEGAKDLAVITSKDLAFVCTF